MYHNNEFTLFNDMNSKKKGVLLRCLDLLQDRPNSDKELNKEALVLDIFKN